MGESQNIEYKESWRDEYLKWICGFANSQGGTLYVGIKDNGKICGVSDSKKLMEDLPKEPLINRFFSVFYLKMFFLRKYNQRSFYYLMHDCVKPLKKVQF